MERYFIIDKYNTWYDWSLILTSKDVTPPEPNTHYVTLDGMSGSLDLSEALTGEITYKDRHISATFWTDYGTRKDREKLLKDIRSTLHGRKVKIIEPDDMSHYFVGRITIKSVINNLAYATFTLEATCEPWRYDIEDSVRTIEVNSNTVSNVVLRLQGVKTVTPIITVTGTVNVVYNGVKTALIDGSYMISDIRLHQGVNVVGVSGNGSVTFTYREADL